MTVDNCGKDQGQACRIDVASRGMDDHGCQDPPYRRPPYTRRSSKSKAPPPPPAVKGLDGPPLSPTTPAYQRTAMEQDDPLDQDLTLVVVLPEGVEKTTVVHGSKPMMDLLVTLCAKYHLNPSGHTIELVSKNRNHIKFKPNALIGTLEAEKILLKPKGMEEKNKKAGPQMPEATVRLVINYKKTQKTILRVSPKVPLNELLPAISEKCEFDTETTILLRNVQSDEPLDLTNSLNDLGIREVYARDTKAASPTELPPSPTHSDTLCLSARKDKSQKERENKENRGLFSLFRRSRKKSDQPMTASAPASPILRKQRPVSMCALPSHTSSYSSNTMPSDVPKKRRAPLPPTMMSPECTLDLGAVQEAKPQSPTHSDGHQNTPSMSRASPSESSLKRTKRKAPLPPTSTPSPSPPEEAPQERSLTASGVPSQAPLEEIREQEECQAPVSPQEEPVDSAVPHASSTLSDAQGDDSSLNLSADISMDSGRAEASSPSNDADMLSLSACEDAGEDQLCDLSSHGKLVGSLTSTEENASQTLSTEAQVGPEGEDDDSSVDPALKNSEQDASSAQEATVPEEIPGGIADPSCSPQAVGSSEPPPDNTPPQDTEKPASESEPEGPGSRAASSLEEHTQHETSRTSSPEVPASTPMASSTPSSTPTPSLKDMAMSTEELRSSEAVSAVTDAPTLSPANTPASTSAPALAMASALLPATAKGSPLHITDSKPKPKPSNEVTRDYIPKVGMTTYTIVPQKSLEKLRYFEVELTLEMPEVATIPEVSVGPVEASDNVVKSHNESATTAQPADAPSATPRADPPLRNGAEPSDSSSKHVTPPLQAPISACIPAADGATSDRQAEEPGQAVPTATAAVEAAEEVKEKKVPPATKPKPASFRLPQHKRTPGYYVTSAVVKSAGSHKEAVGGQPKESSPQAIYQMAAKEREEVEEEGSLPPPLSPLEPTGEEEQVGAPVSAPAQPNQKPIDTSPSPVPSPSPVHSPSPIPTPILSPSPIPSPILSPSPIPNPICNPIPSPSPSPSPNPIPSPVSSPSDSENPDTRLMRQSSLPLKNQPPSPGLSLEKLRTFAAPKPYSPTSPSRFAQAVSSAVKRSHSLSQGPVGQTTHKVPLYPFTGHSPITELTEPSKNTVTDNGEKEDKCPGAQGAEEAVTSSSSEDTGPADTRPEEPAAPEDQIHGNGAHHALQVSGVPPSMTLLPSSGETQAAHEE